MRLFLVSLLASSIVFAGYKEDITYVMKLYQDGEYQKDYNFLDKNYERYLQYPRWHFYFGLVALKLHRYKEAQAAFERVLIIDPSNMRAKLELARVYFLQKRYKLAKELFKEVLKENIPPQVRKNIQKFLVAIDKREHHFSALLMLGVGYDSNVNTLNDSDSVYIPALNLSFKNRTKPKEDMFQNTFLSITHNGGAIENSFIVYAKALRHYNSYSTLYFAYKPLFAVSKGKDRFKYGAIFEKLFYGGENYLHTFGVTASYTHTLKDKIFQAALLAQKKYPEGKNRRKSYYYETSFSMRHFVKKSLLGYGVRLRFERKVDTKLSNISFNGVDIFSEYSYQFKKFLVGASYMHRFTNYLDQDRLFLNKRRDRCDEGSIFVDYLFHKKNSLRFVAKAISTRSNQSIYTYHKNMVGINFIRSF